VRATLVTEEALNVDHGGHLSSRGIIYKGPINRQTCQGNLIVEAREF